MTTYKDSGVDIVAGDRASRAAYMHAASTFASRKGMVGAPLFEEDGFAGFLDMGEYYLVQTTDGTGTKMDVAAQVRRYDTLGYDLLAMVADDAVCTGAEVISVSNCIDVPKVNPAMIDQMLAGLSKACVEQKIVIPAGEIAEVPGAVTRGVWSATAIGIVAKDRVIKPKAIVPGDAVIALQEKGARCNGFSLIRKILSDAHGMEWFTKEWRDGLTWGEAALMPSTVYHSAILGLIGRYGEECKIPVKGIAHITGGGIQSKLRRVLKRSGCGAELTNLRKPHDFITDLVVLGNIPMEEAYRTWNMGNGMLVITAKEHADSAIMLLQKEGICAQRAGSITKDPVIHITAFDRSIIVC